MEFDNREVTARSDGHSRNRMYSKANTCTCFHCVFIVILTTPEALGFLSVGNFEWRLI